MPETLESLTKEGHYTLVLIHPDGHLTASRVLDEGQGVLGAAATTFGAVVRMEAEREQARRDAS